MTAPLSGKANNLRLIEGIVPKPWAPLGAHFESSYGNRLSLLTDTNL
jgi:hypothetical protein